MGTGTWGAEKQAANPVDRPEEGRVLLTLPPQGLSGVPLGPHGLRPVGFSFGLPMPFYQLNPLTAMKRAE